ncbi:hypothetical protein GCM10009557_46330 [Virgisporangium ochraceum]|uniref:hypothetical protein n=1 Tax=Virgisporangium ochraceum TaxID=65505 RepID=UPI001943AFC4|nr:hypothetical protein [Virgisporangium ochraceum]
MKRKILRAVSIAAITGAGLFAFSAPAAAHGGHHYDDYGYNSYNSYGGYGGWGGGMWSGYNAGFGNGNQFSSVIQAPVSVCGNAIAIAGFASASCRGGAYAYNGGW